MTDESRDLSPENLKSLIDMLQLAMKQEADGKPMIQRMAVSEDRVRILIREENEKEREELRRELQHIWDEMKQFVPADQINQKFERVGIPVEHYEEIGPALRAYVFVYRFAQKIGLGIVAALLTALAGYFFKSIFKIDLDIGGR